MIIAKNLLALRKSQTSGGRSCSSQLICQSSSMPQSCSTGPVEELLLLVRNSGGRKGQEFFPIGIAGKQIGIPPNVAGLDGFALGVRKCGNAALRPGISAL